MPDYPFTLNFALPVAEADVDRSVERLGECGCDDALLGIGRRGRLALAFTREADSAEAALLGAIADVRRAIPGAQLIEASPDLVGLTDVAELLHVSRQNVRKLILGLNAPAPVPVHEGRPTIWRLAKVLEWLREQKHYAVDDELVALAKATMRVNLAVSHKEAEESSLKAILAVLD